MNKNSLYLLYDQLVEEVFTSTQLLFQVTMITRTHLPEIHKLERSEKGWNGVVGYWVEHKDGSSSEALIVYSEQSKLWEPVSQFNFGPDLKWTDRALLEMIALRPLDYVVIPLFTQEHVAAVQGRKGAVSKS